MPREARDPSDPRDWLRRVRSNLARAQAGPASDDVLYEDLCFDAQQAAEKALKAVLVATKTNVPKTHSIERLVGLLREGGVAVPGDLDEAAELTRFAAQGRYPTWHEDASREEYLRALELAVRVARWAEDVVAREWKANDRD
jgi:HEPN domain-containing protein